jgi:hypothetical protein
MQVDFQKEYCDSMTIKPPLIHGGGRADVLRQAAGIAILCMIWYLKKL